MNANELKMISKYMELKEVELTGLAVIPNNISEKAFFTFPETAVVLSDGNVVVAIDIEEAEMNAELEAIKENFETLANFKEDKFIIIKVF